MSLIIELLVQILEILFSFNIKSKTIIIIIYYIIKNLKNFFFVLFSFSFFRMDYKDNKQLSFFAIFVGFKKYIY